MKTGLVGALVLALLLLLGSARQVHAQAAATPTLDPAIWGVYAKVVGRDWMHQEYKRKKHWLWEDGKIVEEYVDHEPGFADGKAAVIERGADPGRLTYSVHVDGINHMWDGVVSPDGSILWIKRSMFKQPFRVRLDGADNFVLEWVKFKGDTVVPTKYVDRYAAIEPDPVAKTALASNAKINRADISPPPANATKRVASPVQSIKSSAVQPQKAAEPNNAAMVVSKRQREVSQAADSQIDSATWKYYLPKIGTKWQYFAQSQNPWSVNEQTRSEKFFYDYQWVVPGQILALTYYNQFGVRTAVQLIRPVGQGKLEYTNAADGTKFLVTVEPDGSSMCSDFVFSDTGKTGRTCLRTNGNYLIEVSTILIATGEVLPRDYLNRTQLRLDSAGYAAAIEETKEDYRLAAVAMKKRQDWHAYEARMSGIYNALQVTGAIIDEHAAQTQASLDATLARAAAQGDMQRQKQARAQAEAAAQASTAQSRNEDAESTRKQTQAAAERERSRAEAQQQAEQQRLAAAKQREAERAQRVADRRRQEELARQKQRQALQDQLAAERRGIQLRALKCPGIGNQITGLRPRVTPRIADCVTVQFEAHCPGTQPGQGVTGSFYNFIGSTGNISCANDTIELPAGLSCPAEQVRVDVRDVAACN
jgi:hypothetical protein